MGAFWLAGRTAFSPISSSVRTMMRNFALVSRSLFNLVHLCNGAVVSKLLPRIDEDHAVLFALVLDAVVVMKRLRPKDGDGLGDALAFGQGAKLVGGRGIDNAPPGDLIFLPGVTLPDAVACPHPPL